MHGSVSIRAMVGRHHNSMKINLRKNSADPLNYESIFSGQVFAFYPKEKAKTWLMEKATQWKKFSKDSS